MTKEELKCINVVLAEVLRTAPRAHTYASENADVYRAYDAGYEQAIKDARRALARDSNKEEKAHER